MAVIVEGAPCYSHTLAKIQIPPTKLQEQQMEIAMTKEQFKRVQKNILSVALRIRKYNGYGSRQYIAGSLWSLKVLRWELVKPMKAWKKEIMCPNDITKAEFEKEFDFLALFIYIPEHKEGNIVFEDRDGNKRNFEQETGFKFHGGIWAPILCKRIFREGTTFKEIYYAR